MANITGWGRGTWGQSTWGEPLPVTITAPSAATGAVGNVAIDAAGRFGIIGVAATTGSPTAGVNAQAIAVATSAVATLGSVTVDVDGYQVYMEQQKERSREKASFSSSHV